MRAYWIILALALFVFAVLPVAAQDFQQGFVPFQAYDTNPIDSINLEAIAQPSVRRS